MTRRRKSTSLRALIAVALLSVGACGDDSGPSGPADPCGYAALTGVRVASDGDVLATQWRNAVSGSIALDFCTPSRIIDVALLGADSTALAASPCGAIALSWDVADTSIASISTIDAESASFLVTAKQLGATTAILRAANPDSVTFEFRSVNVVVGPAPATEPFTSAEGFAVIRKCTEVASWNLKEEPKEQGSFGEIIVAAGSTTEACEAHFFDHDGPFDPITERPTEIVPPVACLRLDWEIADESVATIERVEGAPWSFTVGGERAGTTTVEFFVTREGTVRDVATGPITIIVEDPAAPAVEPGNYMVVLAGVPQFFVRDGALIDSCGTRVATPGRLEGIVGQITDGHYFFRRTTDECQTGAISADEYRLAFEFEDPCIAGVVNHPEHWNVLTSFHLEGLAPGDTRVKIRLVRGDVVVYTTPWVAVHVTAAANT